MAHDNMYEVPLLSVLDEHDVDQLLQKLRVVYREARFDLAPELCGGDAHSPFAQALICAAAAARGACYNATWPSRVTDTAYFSKPPCALASAWRTLARARASFEGKAALVAFDAEQARASEHWHLRRARCAVRARRARRALRPIFAESGHRQQSGISPAVCSRAPMSGGRSR
jgi:hypothetical protein